MADFEVLATSEDGKRRVIIAQDTDCENPMEDDDGWVTSLLTYDGRPHTYTGRATWQARHDPKDRLDAIWHFLDSAVETVADEPDEAFVRYMRIFHGIEVHRVSVTDGYRDTSRGLAWVEPSERERTGAPGTDKEVIEPELKTLNAWAEGDCWYYAIEERVKWARVDTIDHLGDYDHDGIRETWETVEAVGGFIGREYAEEEARAALAGER